MKRYFSILVILVVIVSSAQSQILISLLFGEKLNAPGLEFGLEGGYNWSGISSLETDKKLSTFNLGFYFDIRLKNQLYLYTGVLVKSKLGAGNLSDNDLIFLQTNKYDEAGIYNQAISYFLVPALAKYKFKNHIYFEAGPQFGLMYNAYVEFSSSSDDKDARIRDYNKEQINRLDAGILAGIGYTLMEGKGISLGVKYYQGFVGVYKDRSDNRNRSLFFKVNIPIGGVSQ